MNRNERTPRTLADTVYSTGYTSASIRTTRQRIADLAYAVVFLAACAAIAAMLATEI